MRVKTRPRRRTLAGIAIVLKQRRRDRTKVGALLQRLHLGQSTTQHRNPITQRADLRLQRRHVRLALKQHFLQLADTSLLARITQVRAHILNHRIPTTRHRVTSTAHVRARVTRILVHGSTHSDEVVRCCQQTELANGLCVLLCDHISVLLQCIHLLVHILAVGLKPFNARVNCCNVGRSAKLPEVYYSVTDHLIAVIRQGFPRLLTPVSVRLVPLMVGFELGCRCLYGREVVGADEIGHHLQRPLHLFLGGHPRRLLLRF